MFFQLKLMKKVFLKTYNKFFFALFEYKLNGAQIKKNKKRQSIRLIFIMNTQYSNVLISKAIIYS